MTRRAHAGHRREVRDIPQQWRFTVPGQGRVAPQQQAANLERAINRSLLVSKLNQGSVLSRLG